MKIIQILLIGIGTTFISCQRDRHLNSVLAYSGDNRQALEQVLEHYEKVDCDSLKWEAARFLIENMPGHYYWDGKAMSHWQAQIDTLPQLSRHTKKMLEMVPAHFQEARANMTLCEDVKCLTAAYLISRIDSAFAQWRNRPWLARVDYETFRDYLLPYRVENEVPDYWRDSIGTFQKTWEEGIKWFDDCHRSMTEFARIFFSLSNNLQLHQIIPDYKSYHFDCISTAQIELFAMRTIGIPAAIDFTPGFANRNSRHYWMQPIDAKIKNEDCFQLKLNTAGKVYRRTYAHNPTPEYNGREYIPPFFTDPFNKDVTPLYLQTCDVEIRLERPARQRYIYLAIFNDLEWKPVAWGKRSGRKVVFHDMGKNVVYLPVCFEEDGSMQAVAPPFILYNNGETHPLAANEDTTTQLVLERKYSLLSQSDDWTSGMTGSYWECSDFPDFHTKDTAFVFHSQPAPGYNRIKVEKKYQTKKYWRFVPQSDNCWLADIVFQGKDGNKLPSKMLGNKPQELLDADPLTYINVDENLEWQIDGRHGINEIHCLCRNDANGIFPGDTYELFYYHFPEGWVSLGQQSAKKYTLLYNAVPANGLYWLRNLTQGREERIFTWEKGNINFW